MFVYLLLAQVTYVNVTVHWLVETVTGGYLWSDEEMAKGDLNLPQWISVKRETGKLF